jgi:hypothetical protein
MHCVQSSAEQCMILAAVWRLPPPLLLLLLLLVY